MRSQVFEEALSEDSLKGRLARANRFVQLSQRAPKKSCGQKQHGIALRLGMIHPENIGERRVCKPPIGAEREHP